MSERSFFLNKTIGVRVTEGDLARLQALSDARGKPLGEWCRGVLLEKAETSEQDAVNQILLGELLALRTILLNLFFKLTNGEPITAEEMQGLIDRADRDKLSKALARIKGTERTLIEGGVQ